MKNKFIIIAVLFTGMLLAGSNERNIYILSKTVGEKIAHGDHRRIHLDEKLVLSFALYNDEMCSWHSDFNRFFINSDTVSALPLNNEDILEIKWFIIIPQKTDTIYANNYQALLPWSFIRYEERELLEFRDKQKINFASLNDYYSMFPGTVRLKVEVRYKNQFIATPGIEQRYVVASGDYGGLDSMVFQLAVAGKSESDFINNLLSFRHVPYLENPGSWNGNWNQHQTVELIGANMRTALVRSMQLAGKDYHSLIQHFPLPSFNQFQITDFHLGKVVKNHTGIYIYENKPVQLSDWLFTTGDFLLCKGRIFVFYTDKSKRNSIYKGEANGMLDINDIIIGASGGEFLEFPLETMDADTLKLIRWNTRWHRDY